jgi:signal transduction histidine kinase
LDCLQELRHLVFDLRLADLERLSLAEELRKYVAEFGRRSNIDAHFRVSGRRKEPPLNVKKNLYRIAQEALTNVRRHAQASRVDVWLKYTPHQMELTITDDGQGFQKEEVLGRAQEEKRFGLLGMQERTYLLGGRLEIKSKPSQGATVRVIVPF